MLKSESADDTVVNCQAQWHSQVKLPPATAGAPPDPWSASLALSWPFVVRFVLPVIAAHATEAEAFAVPRQKDAEDTMIL